MGAFPSCCSCWGIERGIWHFDMTSSPLTTFAAEPWLPKANLPRAFLMQRSASFRMPMWSFLRPWRRTMAQAVRRMWPSGCASHPAMSRPIKSALWTPGLLSLPCAACCGFPYRAFASTSLLERLETSRRQRAASIATAMDCRSKCYSNFSVTRVTEKFGRA